MFCECGPRIAITLAPRTRSGQRKKHEMQSLTTKISFGNQPRPGMSQMDDCIFRAACAELPTPGRGLLNLLIEQTQLLQKP
jgi:hypothetical protein